MATTFDVVSIRGLRATHFEQVMAAIMAMEDEGIYYGNKEQYYKRHEEIKKWLGSIILAARQPDNRIPT